VLQRTNRFLARLGDEIDLIRPHLREVLLKPGEVLYEPGDQVTKVYFPHYGMISKLAVFEDGTEIECALVGREGSIGATAAIGLKTSVTRDVCQIRASASVIDVPALERAAARSEHIHTIIDRYCAWKMGYVIRNGACNARHSVEQRLCRWLLSCSDVLEQRQIDLRQDVFATMLGVQRTTVSPILQRFRAEGLIELGRGRVIVLDKAMIRQRTCECYEAMRAAEQDLLPLPVSPASRSFAPPP
jgi:CRP-like cAMP-binding protein